jgi:Flp pilus assembly protein TadD
MPDATRVGLEKAFDHFRRGQYAEAFATLDIVVQADPKNGEAWMGRFFAAFPLGRYADAATSLARAAELGAFPRGYRYDPRPLFDASAGANAGTGEGTPSTSAFDGHFGRLSTHLNANPSDPDGYAVLAYLHVALGRPAEAQAALASLAALRPADPLLPHLRTALLPPEQQPQTPAPTQPVR